MYEVKWGKVIPDVILLEDQSQPLPSPSVSVASTKNIGCACRATETVSNRLCVHAEGSASTQRALRSYLQHGTE